MMTCNDCINSDKCPTALACLGNPICPMFKYKSRYIELPCKVGDKVYRPSKYLGVVQFIITSFNMYQSEMFFKDDSDNIIYLPDIGKTVFLTREEAEKKLRGIENNA